MNAKCSRCCKRTEIVFGKGKTGLCQPCYNFKWVTWHKPTHLRDPNDKNPPDIPGQTMLDIKGESL
jgi:hypothetical protein